MLLGLGRDRSADVRAAAERRISRAWNDQRRAELTGQFVATGVPTAGDLAAAVTRALDRYRDDWMAMRLDAWAGTNLRGEQTADLLERRVVCLDRAADELTALVALLVTLGPTRSRAPETVFGMTPLSRWAVELVARHLSPRPRRR